jgi:hypothetical protein
MEPTTSGGVMEPTKVKGVRESPWAQTWTFIIDHPETEDRDKLLQSSYQYLIMTKDQETLRGFIHMKTRRTRRQMRKLVHPRAQWKLGVNIPKPRDNQEEHGQLS